MKDMKNTHSVVASLAAANRTADANGTGVDLKGYEGALVVAIVGAEGDTLGASDLISLELEESDDDSTYTDVAVADRLDAVGGSSGQFALIDAAAEAPAVHVCSYIGSKRYIRVVDNRTGTHTNGTPTSAVVVRGHARHNPAGATQTP